MQLVFSFFWQLFPVVCAEFILYKYTKMELDYTKRNIKYQKMTNSGAKCL